MPYQTLSERRGECCMHNAQHSQEKHDKMLYWASLGVSLLFGILLCAGVYAWYAPTHAFLLGSALGFVCMALGIRLFFAAWHAAPDQAKVARNYGLRLAVVFGSVALALFVPFVDALGVLLPQLFPIPVLAVLMLLPDFSKGGKR